MIRRSPTTRDPQVVATVSGLLTILPLLVWWAGWYPGIMSSDSIDQWNQAITFEFFNAHPITHTAYLWVISTVWQSPGAVALFQVVAMAVLLGVIARRLTQVGIPVWLAAATVWLIALLPMTAATTITLWKDIPFALAMGLAFTELLLLAVDSDHYWSTRFGAIRLGIALGLMWAVRANGKYTVILFVAAIAVVYRDRIRTIVALAGTAIAVGVVLPMILLATLPVNDQPIDPAQVFMPDMAAVVNHAFESLSPTDIGLLEAVAPLEVWRDRYECGDSSPLLFDARYDNSVIQQNPWDYRFLVMRSALRAPATVLGHRWCAGEYLVSPFNRTGTFMHRPPYDIWPNTLGLARSPISDRAFALTSWMYVQAERSSIEWMTWRPALFMLVGLATFVGIWRRRRLRPLRWIGVLFFIHLANVFATSPSHEFRYAFGLYLIALASLPLWHLIANPERATIVPTEASLADVRRAAPVGDEAGSDSDR